MIVAVGRRDRQSILQQLDAVLVVVDGIEIGAAAREEQLVVAVAALGPDAGHVAQHVRDAVDVTAIQFLAIDDRDTAGRQGALRLDLGLHPLPVTRTFSSIVCTASRKSATQDQRRHVHSAFNRLEARGGDSNGVFAGLNSLESITTLAIGRGGTSHDEAAQQLDLRTRDGRSGLVGHGTADAARLLSGSSESTCRRWKSRSPSESRDSDSERSWWGV